MIKSWSAIQRNDPRRESLSSPGMLPTPSELGIFQLLYDSKLCYLFHGSSMLPVRELPISPVTTEPVLIPVCV